MARVLPKPTVTWPAPPDGMGINRYYNDHYGRVTRSHRQLRYAIASLILFPAAMVGGPILDSSFDLPVSAFAWLPIGVATIVAGIFNHRALVRAYGPAKDRNPESSDVRA